MKKRIISLLLCLVLIVSLMPAAAAANMSDSKTVTVRYASGHGVNTHDYAATFTYSDELFTNKKSKTNPQVSKAMLEAAIPMLEALPDWTDESIHDGLVNLAASLEVKNATLMWPVRIAAAGKLVTPGGAVELCRILGRDETLRRLRSGLGKLTAC